MAPPFKTDSHHISHLPQILLSFSQLFSVPAIIRNHKNTWDWIELLAPTKLGSILKLYQKSQKWLSCIRLLIPNTFGPNVNFSNKGKPTTEVICDSLLYSLIYLTCFSERPVSQPRCVCSTHTGRKYPWLRVPRRVRGTVLRNRHQWMFNFWNNLQR